MACPGQIRFDFYIFSNTHSWVCPSSISFTKKRSNVGAFEHLWFIPNLTFDHVIFYQTSCESLADFFYKGALNVENLSIYFVAKLYYFGLSIQTVYQVERCFRWEKSWRNKKKVRFWTYKNELSKVRHWLKKSYQASKKWS